MLLPFRNFVIQFFFKNKCVKFSIISIINYCVIFTDEVLVVFFGYNMWPVLISALQSLVPAQ